MCVCVGMYGAGGTSVEVCTGTCSLTQSEHRQTETDRRTGAYSAVLPVGFPSLCQASETPSALAPPRLRDTCDGSPSAERGEGEGGGGKEREREEEGRRGRRREGEGRRKKDKKRKENQSRSSVLTCFSQR